MLELKEILSKQIITNLLSIDYKYIPISDKDTEIKYYDEIEINELTDDYINLFITRKVFFVPECFFNIIIKYSVERFLDEEYKDKASFKEYNILSEFQKDSGLFTKYEEGWVSLLISQITSAFGNSSPLVTPPLICLEVK